MKWLLWWVLNRAFFWYRHWSFWTVLWITSLLLIAQIPTETRDGSITRSSLLTGVAIIGMIHLIVVWPFGNLKDLRTRINKHYDW